MSRLDDMKARLERSQRLHGLLGTNNECALIGLALVGDVERLAVERDAALAEVERLRGLLEQVGGEE